MQQIQINVLSKTQETNFSVSKQTRNGCLISLELATCIMLKNKVISLIFVCGIGGRLLKSKWLQTDSKRPIGLLIHIESIWNHFCNFYNTYFKLIFFRYGFSIDKYQNIAIFGIKSNLINHCCARSVWRHIDYLNLCCGTIYTLWRWIGNIFRNSGIIWFFLLACKYFCSDMIILFVTSIPQSKYLFIVFSGLKSSNLF